MRLILDRNCCSNPQAPPPAFFFSLCLFLCIYCISHSIFYFLHLLFSFSPFFLHSYDVNSLEHQTLISNVKIVFPSIPPLLLLETSTLHPSSLSGFYLSLLVAVFSYLIPLFLLTAFCTLSSSLLPFLSSFLPPHSPLIFPSPLPLSLSLFLPLHILHFSSPLPPLFLLTSSPSLPPPPSVHSSSNLLLVMGLLVLNTRWLSAVGQTAAVLW